MAKKNVKWEQLMLQVDRLIATSNESLYERVVLLDVIADDVEFIAFHKHDADAMEDHLDQKLGDFGISFFNARSMLKHFPSKEQWGKAKIRDLLAEALQNEQQSRSEAKQPTAERQNPIPRKEHERVVSQLTKDVGNLTERTESLADENARLRQENDKLRHENAELRGRLSELERIVNRELQEA